MRGSVSEASISSEGDEAGFVSYYGAMKKTHSVQGLQGIHGSRSSLASHGSRMSRENSLNDLPLVAIAGINTRVSIGNITSASQLDLQELFQASEADGLPLDIEAVVVEGGWTAPLILSAGGALLSALAFGYNNANMNTQAAVMRDALGLPGHLDEGCVVPGNPTEIPGNDMLWGFCVSGFCLSALLGSTVAGQLADRHGRRKFLLGNSLLYLGAALIEAMSGPLTIPGKVSEAERAARFCNPTPNTAALVVLLLGRLLTGVACGGSTVAVPMYLGETAPAHLRGTLGSAFLLTAVTGMLFGQLAGLPSVLGTPTGWPWILAGAALPALLQLIVFQPLLLESPRWLLLHGQPAAAAEALARLRGCTTSDVELIEELETMGDGLGLINFSADMALAKHDGKATTLFDAALREPMMQGKQGLTSHGSGFSQGLSGGRSPSSTLRLSSMGNAAGRADNSNGSDTGASSSDAAPWGALQHVVVSEPAMRKPLAICLTLMAAQQLSGINNAFNYSSSLCVRAQRTHARRTHARMSGLCSQRPSPICNGRIQCVTSVPLTDLRAPCPPPPQLPCQRSEPGGGHVDRGCNECRQRRRCPPLDSAYGPRRQTRAPPLFHGRHGAL